MTNLLAIRKYLQNTERSPSEQSGNPRNEKGQLQGKYPVSGSCRDISKWLDVKQPHPDKEVEEMPNSTSEKLNLANSPNVSTYDIRLNLGNSPNVSSYDIRLNLANSPNVSTYDIVDTGGQR